MARRPIEIDRDKLRAAIRKFGDEYVFHMLDDTIDLLPPAKLHKIVRKYIDLKRLRPHSERATKASLLADVKAFEKASLAGEYYETFNVNSRNFMEKFKGTTGWIAECRGLLDRCAEPAQTAILARFFTICGTNPGSRLCPDELVGRSHPTSECL